MPINKNVAASEYTAYVRANSNRYERKFVPPEFTNSLISALTVNSKVGQTLQNKPLPPIPGYLTFDGTSYLSSPINISAETDFTVEMFAKVTDSVSLQYLFSLYIAGGYFDLKIEDGRMIIDDDDGTIDIRFPDELLNAWHHYAVYRESGSVSLYIDGVRTSQTELVTEDPINLIYIGGGPDLAGFTGQLTNFRVTPRALYSVPGLPLLANDSQLLLLANPEGAYTDSSSYTNTIVVNGSVRWNYGPIQVAKPIFSAYGVLTGFDENHWLYYDDFHSMDDSFTIEMCFKTSGTSNYEGIYKISSTDEDGEDDRVRMFINSGVVYVYNGNMGFSMLVPQPNTWYHIAVTYDGGDNKWYTSVNGITTYRDTYNFVDGGSPRQLYIGSDGTQDDLGLIPFYSGSISNFRVSDYARYTENFRVPSLPLSAEGASSLIMGTPWAPFYDSVRNENSEETCDVLLGPISIGVYTVTTLEYNTNLGPSFSWSGGTFIRKTESPYIYAGVVTSIEEVPSPGNLMSATLGHSVKSIGGVAFYYCTSLISVTIPNSVRSIGDAAFYNCTALTSITIPNSVTSIGNSAFHYCTSLRSITIPNSVTSIGDYAFYYCTSLTSIEIPNSVTSIGDYAFAYCTSLTSITIPNSVTSIGGYGAFYNCTALISVTIPNSVTSIGGVAFYNCTSLISVTIPNSVKSIGDGAFYDCTALTSITIPNSVKSIGDGAFYYCTSLRSITIPNSVTSIGGTAFSYSGLTTVIIANNQLPGIPSPSASVFFYGKQVATVLPQ